MKNKFLEKFADDIVSRYGETLERILFVFPSRRAGVFFTRHLQRNEKIKKPLWMPEIITITDFVKKISRRRIPAKLSLLFKLFNLYKKIYPNDRPEDFDEFYQWGSMLLNDFKDIDLYLVNYDDLFRNLEEIARLEEHFDSSGDIKKGKIFKRYLSFADKIGKLYKGFTKLLSEDGTAYYGHAVRLIAEDPGQIAEKTGTFEKIIFAGFNALSKGEELIIRKIIEEDRGEIYWDMDRYIAEDDIQEAGLFFRNRVLDRENPRWVEDLLGTKKKNIQIIGASGNIASAKTAGVLLKSLQKELGGKFDDEETAVILPDEKLLFPLLHSLPEDIRRINVTMGYPLKSSPVYILLASVIEMHENMKRMGKSREYYYRDVKKVLLHPYIRFSCGDNIHKLIKTIKEKNIIYVPRKMLVSGKNILKKIFREIVDTKDFMEYIGEIIIEIKDTLIGDGKDNTYTVELEFVYRFYLLLQKLGDEISRSQLDIELSTFWCLFREIIETTSIPFRGEPLEGLQIMGLLETRALDFRNVFILSVNEGILPAGKSERSFIPDDIRRIIGMPTFRQSDAIFAYYFYRLITRAENVVLLYNTNPDKLGKGGKSRYIEQLQYEFSEKNSSSVIENKIASPFVKCESAGNILIKKDSEIIDKMKTMSYSPTSLNAYIQCPLKFYFQYVIGLREKSEVIESADEGMFGSVIHQVLQRMYRDYAGREINGDILRGLKKQARDYIKTSYGEITRISGIETGRNLVYIETMYSLVKKFLRCEMKEKECTILSLEDNYGKKGEFYFEFSGYKLRLKGTIDRIDMKEGVYRIIDYKTGTENRVIIDINVLLNSPDIIDQLSKKKEVLQLLFYFYLFTSEKELKDSEKCLLGIYWLRNLSDGVKYLKIPRGKTPLYFSGSDIPRVKKVLKAVFSEIFDPGKPFEKTDDTGGCKYCNYKNICLR